MRHQIFQIVFLQQTKHVKAHLVCRDEVQDLKMESLSQSKYDQVQAIFQHLANDYF